MHPIIVEQFPTCNTLIFFGKLPVLTTVTVHRGSFLYSFYSSQFTHSKCKNKYFAKINSVLHTVLVNNIHTYLHT